LSRHLCLVGRFSKGSHKFGSDLRLESIKEFLSIVGWSYCVLSPKGYLLSKNHPSKGVCIVSFVNAWLIPLAKKRQQKIWLDVMDSRFLTIKWQLKSKNFLNFFRVVRTLLIGIFIRSIELQSYISRRDMEIDAPKGRSFVLPNRSLAIQLQPSSIKRFVMLGDWSYYPNRYGLMEFIKVVWLKGELSKAGILLSIYGRGFPQNLRSIPGVVFCGYGEMVEIFTEKSIFISPISIGSGVKNKTLMPLKAGCIVVTLPEGAIGLEDEPNLIVVEDFFSMVHVLKQYSMYWPDPEKTPLVSESLKIKEFKHTIEEVFNSDFS
jgi:hypothetical protein